MDSFNQAYEGISMEQSVMLERQMLRQTMMLQAKEYPVKRRSTHSKRDGSAKKVARLGTTNPNTAKATTMNPIFEQLQRQILQQFQEQQKQYEKSSLFSSHVYDLPVVHDPGFTQIPTDEALLCDALVNPNSLLKVPPNDSTKEKDQQSQRVGDEGDNSSADEEEVEGLFTVTVLPGYSQGMTMRFRTPKGTVCAVEIPDGINAGDSFRVAVPEESTKL